MVVALMVFMECHTLMEPTVVMLFRIPQEGMLTVTMESVWNLDVMEDIQILRNWTFAEFVVEMAHRVKVKILKIWMAGGGKTEVENVPRTPSVSSTVISKAKALRL